MVFASASTSLIAFIPSFVLSFSHSFVFGLSLAQRRSLLHSLSNIVHFSYLVALASSALWFTTSVNAAPTDGELVEMLIKRAILGYEDCTDDQKKKAGRAFADAATLARWTYDKKLKDGTNYQNTDACVAQAPFS